MDNEHKGSTIIDLVSYTEHQMCVLILKFGTRMILVGCCWFKQMEREFSSAANLKNKRHIGDDYKTGYCIHYGLCL
jgi:hypothetical protein